MFPEKRKRKIEKKKKEKEEERASIDGFVGWTTRSFRPSIVEA